MMTTDEDLSRAIQERGKKVYILRKGTDTSFETKDKLCL